MPLLQPNFDPSPKDLRWFAGVWWPCLCGAFGLMCFRKFHLPVAATWLWLVGGLLAAAGLAAPKVIRPVYLGLIRITYPIGWCVSHVALAAMYFLVFTPIGFLVRILHDPMERKFDRAAATYYTPRQASEKNRYFRQL
jgi:hypothetical protein